MLQDSQGSETGAHVLSKLDSSICGKCQHLAECRCGRSPIDCSFKGGLVRASECEVWSAKSR